MEYKYTAIELKTGNSRPYQMIDIDKPDFDKPLNERYQLEFTTGNMFLIYRKNDKHIACIDRFFK